MRVSGNNRYLCCLALVALCFCSTAALPADQAPAIDSLIEPLRQKLLDNPEDVGNWVLLAQSYDYLGRTAEAREAYSKAGALGYQAPVGAAPVGAAPPSTPPQDANHRRPADPVLMQWMANENSKPVPGDAKQK